MNSMNTLMLKLEGRTITELLAQLDEARATIATGTIRASGGEEGGPSWKLDDDHIPRGQSVYLTPDGRAYTEDGENQLLESLGYRLQDPYWVKDGEEDREPADVLCDLVNSKQIELRLRAP